jgi:hypothetical protein
MGGAMFKVRSIFYYFLSGIVLFAFSNQNCPCGFGAPEEERPLVSNNSQQVDGSKITTTYVSFSGNLDFKNLSLSTDDTEVQESDHDNRSLFLYCLFGIFKQFVEQ